MQVAVTLQYFPADGISPPLAICTSVEPHVLHQYREAVLFDHEQRCMEATDPIERLIAESEAARLRELLDVLVPATEADR